MYRLKIDSSVIHDECFPKRCIRQHETDMSMGKGSFTTKSLVPYLCYRKAIEMS